MVRKKLLLASLLILLAVLIYAKPVKGEVIPYLVIDRTTVPGLYKDYTALIFSKVVVIKDYIGGKVMLSGTPDGKGTMHIEDGYSMINFQIPAGAGWHSFCQPYDHEAPAVDVSYAFISYLPDHQNVLTFKFEEWCPGDAYKTNGPVYLTYFKPDVLPSPTQKPSPTPTLTPTPKPPEPFLELPWDYQSKKMSFNDSVLGIGSYFDHEYPLLSVPSLTEPAEVAGSTLGYDGKKPKGRFYSSHDGYDYASRANVGYGDPVLAAADGIATYGGYNLCGNFILIDHENGFQTKYCHLQPEGLITNKIGEKIEVTQGQQIGKVGYSGNVFPTGIQGSHIHFMVIEDKNRDGNFDDNVPDGLVDPLGWQSEDPDPWEQYNFFYNGKKRTGNKSYYLWKQKIDGLKDTLSANGGVFTAGKLTVDFPAGITFDPLNLSIEAIPMLQPNSSLTSLGTPYEINVKDDAYNAISHFLKDFNIVFDFSTLDLYPIKTETISIYSSQDGQNWTKENTNIDWNSKKAKTSVNHLTQFALMAERKDTIAPETTAIIDGKSGEPNWYRTDVSVALSAEDNAGGLGVRYTLFKKDKDDWAEYIEPQIFTQEGHHKIEFFSEDNDGNVESTKTVGFDIDKTVPEATLQFDMNALELVVIGTDNSGTPTVLQDEIEKNKNRFVVTDRAGNMLKIIGRDKEKGKQARIVLESLQYNDQPAISLDPNRFFIQYSLDAPQDDLKKLIQIYEIKGEIKLKLEYKKKTNKTKIITQESGKEKVKEEVEGQRLLKIFSENGTLKYSY